MNALEHRIEVARAESDLADRLVSLFDRCPPLHGFTVQRAEDAGEERTVLGLGEGLSLADVIWHRPLNSEQAAAMVDEISQALLELLDERPETTALLAGRTFARSLS
ncbi:MAG: hypothetical protein ACREVQ_09890 [Burkholderiales bacterium]